MPDMSMVHVDQALTEVSVAYRNTQYVADSVFPVVPVSKQSNKYFIYSKDNFRTLDDARRPGEIMRQPSKGGRVQEIARTRLLHAHDVTGRTLCPLVVEGPA